MSEDLKARDALETVSDIIEEIWAGLVMATENTAADGDTVQAMLRGLLRIANQARGEIDIAQGVSRRA